MAFYGSSQVQVFPSAYRGQYTSGKFTSERNFINIIKTMGDVDSFVVDFSAGDMGTGTLSVIVKGYYFEISNFNTADTNNTYLDVKIKDDYLVNYTNNTTVLDNSSGFAALYHGASAGSSDSLQVIKNGQIINRGYLKALRDEDGNWLKLSGLKITEDGKLDASTIDFSKLTTYVYVAKLIAEGATYLCNSSGTKTDAGATNTPVYFKDGIPKAIGTGSNIGGTTKGVYLTSAGAISPMTYSLSATVNAGTASKLAYYSGANAVSAYSSNAGKGFTGTVVPYSSQMMYISSGIPTGGPTIYYSTSAPSASGNNGDIWFVYE